MTKLDLIDTTIQPDPFKPQVGDVYEFGHPFPQRLVVEDAPSVSDFRVRFRIDGGDSNLTSVRAFHLLLAGFRGLCGVGRVAASESASDSRHQARGTTDEMQNVSLWTVQAALTKLAGSTGHGLTAELVAEAVGLMRAGVMALPSADPLAYVLQAALQQGVSVGMSWSGKADEEQHERACAEVDKLGDPEQVAQLKGLRPWAMVRELVGRLVQERRSLDDARAKLVSEQVDVSERRMALESVQSSLRAAMFSALGREDSTLSTLDLVEQLVHAIRERDEQINTLFSQRDRFFDDYTIVAKREKAMAARLAATERRIADGDNAIRLFLDQIEAAQIAITKAIQTLPTSATLSELVAALIAERDQYRGFVAAESPPGPSMGTSTAPMVLWPSHSDFPAGAQAVVFVSAETQAEIERFLRREQYVLDRESDLQHEVELLKQRVATYEDDFGALISAGWTNGHPVKWAQDKFAELTKERDEARQFWSGLEAALAEERAARSAEVAELQRHIDSNDASFSVVVSSASARAQERDAARTALVEAQEENRMLRDRDESARLDRISTAAWMQSSPLDCLDDSPDIRCWPATGIVIPGSKGPILTIMPEDGRDVAIVHMEDVAAWLQAYKESAIEGVLPKATPPATVPDHLWAVERFKDSAPGSKVADLVVTVLVVKNRIVVLKQRWASVASDFDVASVSLQDDDPRFSSGMGLGDRKGTWTWRGTMRGMEWIGEWTSETSVLAAGVIADLGRKDLIRVDGVATEHIHCLVGEPLMLSNSDDAGVTSWRWSVIAPPTSDPKVTGWRWMNEAGPTPTATPVRTELWRRSCFSFTTDVPGDYTVHLHVVREGSEQELTLTVRAS